MSTKKLPAPTLSPLWTLPAKKSTTYLYLDPTGRPLVSLPAAPVGDARYYLFDASAAPDLAAPMTAHQYESVAHVARARKAAPVLAGDKWECSGFRFADLTAPDLPATLPPAYPLAPAFTVTLPARDLSALLLAAVPDKLIEEREYENDGAGIKVSYLSADVENGRLALAAFDGFRIHARYIPDDYAGAALADDVLARFPLAAVKLAIKAAGHAGDVTLTAGDATAAGGPSARGNWRIDAGAVVMFGAWETVGPNWQAIIPQDADAVIYPAPDPGEFETFLAAAAACGGKSAPVHLRADGAAWVYNVETCPDAFCAGYFPVGAAPYTEREKGAVAVNVTYYADAAEWAGSMTLYGLFPNTPLRLQSADGARVAVIMPMRIDR